jgi:hypothetical protein
VLVPPRTPRYPPAAEAAAMNRRTRISRLHSSHVVACAGRTLHAPAMPAPSYRRLPLRHCQGESRSHRVSREVDGPHGRRATKARGPSAWAAPHRASRYAKRDPCRAKASMGTLPMRRLGGRERLNPHLGCERQRGGALTSGARPADITNASPRRASRTTAGAGHPPVRPASSEPQRPTGRRSPKLTIGVK